MYFFLFYERDIEMHFEGCTLSVPEIKRLREKHVKQLNLQFNKNIYYAFVQIILLHCTANFMHLNVNKFSLFSLQYSLHSLISFFQLNIAIIYKCLYRNK